MLCAISSFAMANILHFSTKSKCSISHFNICETEGRCGENNRGRGEGKHGCGEGYHGCGEDYHGCGEGYHGCGEGYHGRGEGKHGCGEGKHGRGEGYHGCGNSKHGRGEGNKALKECHKAPTLRSTGRPQKRPRWHENFPILARHHPCGEGEHRPLKCHFQPRAVNI